MTKNFLEEVLVQHQVLQKTKHHHTFLKIYQVGEKAGITKGLEARGDILNVNVFRDCGFVRGR